MSKSVAQLNVELAQALGVSDLKGVTKILLEINNGNLPKVTVEKVLVGEYGTGVADRLTTVREVFKLKLSDPVGDAIGG